MLTAHREALNEQIRQLQEHMTKLAGKIDFYRQEIERTSKNNQDVIIRLFSF